jgi:hypothetical protein
VLALLAMGPPSILQTYPKQPPKVDAKKLESREKREASRSTILVSLTISFIYNIYI